MTFTPRRARFAAAVMSLSIWLTATALAVFTSLPQIYIAGVLVFGFTPYLVCIHVIEPNLERRSDRSE